MSGQADLFGGAPEESDARTAPEPDRIVIRVHFERYEDLRLFGELLGFHVTQSTRALRFDSGRATVVERQASLDEIRDPTFRDVQTNLFGDREWWEPLWEGMPEFVQLDLAPAYSVEVEFGSWEEAERFDELLGQKTPRGEKRTPSIWFPEAEIGRIAGRAWRTPEPTNPRYPVFVISKGRWETRLTQTAFERAGVPYRIAVEPQEVDLYAAAGVPREKILATPFSNLGRGSIPVRNFIWDVAKSEGHARHWCFDDNIDGLWRLHQNLKLRCETGATLRAIEDWSDRYDNVGMSGPNYFMFASRKTRIAPLTLNTRVYSGILINHALDDVLAERWRGRYNEDTDLSLRTLKAGWCTALFNAFLILKSTTMTMKGGNTEALYKIKEGEKDGRLLMAESLRDQHPDVTKIAWKWGRWQYQVDYRGFRQNKLRLRRDARPLPDYRMELVESPPEERRTKPEPVPRVDMIAALRTDWRPPTQLPDRLEGVVGVDLETRDEGLAADGGSGWPWRGGEVVGYSVVADNFASYLPIRHAGGGNMDPDVVRRWLNDVLGREDQLKVFANAMYDLGWAGADGVEIRGPVRDVLWMEALLDEHRRSYSLDSVARDRLGEGKDERHLLEAARAFGLVDPKAELWKLPGPHVGAYGCGDADLPRRLHEAQRPLVEAEGMADLCTLEHDLIPMYLDMRRRGVRVDVARAEAMRDRLRGEVAAIVAEARRRTGRELEIWAPESLAPALEAEGMRCPLTPKSRKPSVTQEFLERHDHWLTRAVLQARQKDKLAGTFLEGVILGNLHGGRVHGEIHPLRGDEGGTVTGRLSMSNPNLQFIPSRTEEGRLIRACFLPEEGELWADPDLSQQEPRLLVHFASLVTRRGRPLPGAAEARDRWRRDPRLSYHKFAAELTGLDYVSAKTLNLAIIYGRGVTETARELGISVDEARELFDRHDAEMPFARALSEVCKELVERRGYLRSLLGRRVRFHLWEPARFDDRNGMMLPREAAEKKWPGKRLVRARAHKSLNSLIQPSAADQTKAGMREVWRAGLGRHVLVQVHDALGCSVPETATGRRIAELMERAVPLEVPVVAEVKTGPSWGEVS